MADTDKMVSLGEIATRDGAVVPLHRDYEDLFIGAFRFTPEAVATLKDKIAEWEKQANAYLLRADEGAGLVGRLVEDAYDDSPCPGVGLVVGQVGEDVLEVLWGERRFEEPRRQGTYEPFDALRPAREQAGA